MKWWLFPVFGVLACACYLAIPAGAVADSWYVAVGMLSLVTAVVGIAYNRPEALRAWTLIAAGSALWVAGDALFFYISWAQGTDPIVSLADVPYLVGYPVFAVGLYLLVHQGWRQGEHAHVINSAIVMIAFGLLLWVFAVHPSVFDLSTIEGVISIAYPTMDVFMLGFLVHFVGSTQWQSMAFRTLTAAVVLLLASDIAANVASADVDGISGKLVDVGYLGSYILVGTAAVHPSMRFLTAPTPHTSEATIAASFNFPTVVMVTASSLTPAVVMAVLLARGDPVARWGWAVSISAILLVGLVLFRVSELLRLLQRQTGTLRRVAETDLLTGLPNRRGVERWTERRECRRSALVFLLMDLDRFKDINATFGPRMGDDVLRAVATRLRRTIGSRGMVARVGADEFMVALDAEDVDVAQLAQEMHDALRTPISVRDATLLVEGSIGIAVAGADPSENTPELLGQRAYLAMESAKTVQPRTLVYDNSMERDNSARLLMLSELTAAIDQRHLEVYYQLQVDLSTMAAVGVEALLRWNHPTRGLIEPVDFLPIAERTGLIRPILGFVLEETAAQHRAWRQDGIELTVAVNISTRNLLDITLVEQVSTTIENTGLEPGSLTIEITETSTMTDPPVAIEMLHELRRLGVSLAIDDYGTGYSSLAYLQRLPVQQLKIDKVFVTSMATVMTHRAIVRSTIDLARSLGLTVTAEGVEDRATLLELKDLSCNHVQGYYVGRPVPAHEIPALVAKINAELKEYADTV